MIYNFKQNNDVSVKQIGAKAQSLVELYQAGFEVPEAIILSVDFFENWLSKMKNQASWQKLLNSPSQELCQQIKAKAQKLRFNSQQRNTFTTAIAKLNGELFAVRSSSPEEDLVGQSFAGIYESELGVKREYLEATIAKIFASVFDYRVISYKQQNGLDISQTKIAIIIQRQLDATVSGVGFSLNPLNNAFDEVLINASFGLGEAIVSGIVTADSYVVDTASNKIISQKINDKKIAIKLNPDGGIRTEENPDCYNSSLNEKQIVELANLIKACETHYQMPVDTEWAFVADKLYLLQCRPITTYFPFFKQLLTKKGEHKRFYIDLMMMTQGFEKPMSVLGMELWSTMLHEIKMHMLSPNINGTSPAINGKQYLSITAMSKVVGKTSTNKLISNYDKNIKKIFQDIDIDANRFEGKVDGVADFKWKAFQSLLTMMPAMISGVFGNYQKGIEKYMAQVDDILRRTETLKADDNFEKMANNALAIMVEAMATAPTLIGGMVSQIRLNKIFKNENVEQYITALNMDLEGNPTSEMGHLLLAMASSECFKSISSREAFTKKAKLKDFDAEFLSLYQQFMQKFSARGFYEIDIAAKRIYEDIGMLYDKLKEINTEHNQILEVENKRREAYQKLLEIARGKGKEKQFIKQAQRLKALLGYREHPKYVIVIIIAKLHDICLEIANNFVADGRLDKVYDIFDLKAEQIDKAQKDNNFDLRQARTKNLAGYLNNVKTWPLVIDSRGKIYRPKLEIEDGDYIGEAIAAGKVVGKAKVLHSPYEKPLNNGEILVAKFTEPSWTPIFINAAAVIMEIGGPLQHGGIIAREYGIPCVSGLMGIMEIIKDGDLIEVDGSNGIVRIIEKSGTTTC